MDTAHTIHSAELLLCGCRVDPHTGAVYTACPRHACNVAARVAELPAEPVELPVDPTGQGMRPLCPQCATYRIHPTREGTAIECDDCGHVFSAHEINSFALSIDSKPRVCETCNTIHYGACSCATQQGVA